MIIDQLSTPLTKALAQGNSQAAQFATFGVLGADPGTAYSDGVIVAVKESILSTQRLRLLPYCDGLAGSQFSMRLYGWWPLSHGDGNVNYLVWIPVLMAEFACTACNQSGPTGPPTRLISQYESFCDTITLVQGSLGLTGFINSTGPGTDLIASVTIEMGGARQWSFDFQQSDPVAMNCLWARS